MSMHKPPHPGEFINGVYLEPHGVSVRELARCLNVSPSTVGRLINGESSVSPEMALRLEKVLGRSAESWLMMQQQYDVWQARRTLDLSQLQQLKFVA